MAGKRKHDDKPGYGKLLDAWVAPDNAGEPIGVVATSFTFSPVFFEEECIGRFLQLESDPTEDGPVYLVEREEKLAQLACASALVDQHHCRGTRSLRWDLLPARMPRGLQHSKVSLLYWSNMVRLIIGSANLTEDGYRRNLEVFGVLDFHKGSQTPIDCLHETLRFLKIAGAYSSVSGATTPSLDRWNGLLARIQNDCSEWGLDHDSSRKQPATVTALFSGPKMTSLFDSLQSSWPDNHRPDVASACSPFFDPPEAENAPARRLWGLLRPRGEVDVEFHVAGEEIAGQNEVLLRAPASLLDAEPKRRSAATTTIYRITASDDRPLHAKGIWLENANWSLYSIGSSNFTSAGTGLSKHPNLEANLVYSINRDQIPRARRLLNEAFPESEQVDLESGIRWMPMKDEEEDGAAEQAILPACFGNAIYDCDDLQQARVTLEIITAPPAGWELLTDGDEKLFWGEQDWRSQHSPTECTIPWNHARPPAGFWVRWTASLAAAWWPVNVSSGGILPPPEELKNLPLEVLINILTSARPLHRVLRRYLKQHKTKPKDDDNITVIDPHKRVDTRQFLLQRTRRLSWALNSLRQRLERPVVTIEFLRWRLHGPVGVTALANALVREAKSEEEKAFLITELALELSRVKPARKPGCLPPDRHREEIATAILELTKLIPTAAPSTPKNLKRYMEHVFEEITK